MTKKDDYRKVTTLPELRPSWAVPLWMRCRAWGILLMLFTTPSGWTANDASVEAQIRLGRLSSEIFGLHDRIGLEVVGTTEALLRVTADTNKLILLINDVALRGLCFGSVTFSNSGVVTNQVFVRTNLTATNTVVLNKDVATTNNGVIAVQTVASTNLDVTHRELVVTNAVAITNLGTSRLEFALERSDANKANWTALLGSPRSKMRKVTLALGAETNNTIVVLGVATNRCQLVLLPDKPFLIPKSWRWYLAVFGSVISLAAMILSCARKRSAGAILQGWSWLGWAIVLASFYLCFGPTWCWVAFAILFIIGFAYLALHTEMLRDSGPPPPKDKLRPFSLARTQMAIWFFLSISAFVFIWLMTSSLDTITGTILALMGIGAGTALGAEAQNSGKFNKLRPEKLELEQKPVAELTKEDRCRLRELRRFLIDVACLEAEQKALFRLQELNAELGAVETDPALPTALAALREEKIRLENTNPRTPEQEARLQEVVKNLELWLERERLLRALKLTDSVPGRLNEIEDLLASRPVSKGFFEDVLTDDVGISFHRFQMFVWTVVLGIIFIASVYEGLAMPQFNDTLLALMGISSGTYLGFMIAEPRAAEAPKK